MPAYFYRKSQLISFSTGVSLFVFLCILPFQCGDRLRELKYTDEAERAN